MSHDEELALCYGLDQHIPNNSTINTVKTEFELFNQGLFKNLSRIPEEQISGIKTKQRRICGGLAFMYLIKLLKDFQETTIL